MKLHVYSSSFNPLYSDIQEIPQVFCISEGDVLTIKRKEYCPEECKFDRPFGEKRYEPVCCKDC